LVKRSVSARVPRVPVCWSEKSFSSTDSVPFHLLDRCERLFLSRITQRSLWDRRSFFDLLYECFGHLLAGISEDSLKCHLISGECYADRQYHSGRDGSVRVFRLGLVCVCPMPVRGARLEHWFCFPRVNPYRLLLSNFIRPFPVHDPFSSWCFRRLRSGASEDEMKLVTPSLRKIPLWDGSGEYVADNCLRILVDGSWETFWFEVHTGSEGYDETTFLPRLLSAERHLKGKGRFVVIVPFKRDFQKAQRAIRSYNRLAYTAESKPSLDLEVSEIITYHGIDDFREKLGYYKHYTRV